MSARRLNAQEKAEWALEFASGVMWDWIVKIHHMNRNRTLEGVPARKWIEKINDPTVGRSVSKRLDLVDVLCGTRLRLRIDGSGVVHDTHTFHHQQVTGDFLKNTVSKPELFTKRKLYVEAIVYPQDCSFITIVDTVGKRYIRLPNAKPRFAEGLSYAEARYIRFGDRLKDKQFSSEEELILAKCEYFQTIANGRAAARVERMIRQAKKNTKKAASEELVTWTLVDGDNIEHGTVEPTVRGDAPYDVPQEMPSISRKRSLINHKDLPRNGAKAAATRETNKLVKEAVDAFKAQTSAPPKPNSLPPYAGIPGLEDPASFLHQLADDLD